MINIYKYSINVSAATAFGILMTTSVLAQTACVNNNNNNACSIAADQTLVTVTTLGVGSTLNNAGTVTNALTTAGDNSALTNTGTVGAFARTFGANSPIINFGTVTDFVRTFGDNSAITNGGFIGGGIDITALNPTLNILPGSTIIGNINLSGGGTSTLNISPGVNLDYTLGTGQPTVVNTNGAPFVQNGNQIIVVDPTGFTTSAVFASDLTSSVFNIIDNNVGQTVLNFGATLSGVSQNDNSATNTTSSRAWISGFGGFSRISGDQSSSDVSNTYTGILVGYETGLLGDNQIGVFGGTSQSDIEVGTNTQNTDVDSYFGGAYWKRDIGKHRLHLALTAGSADHSYTRSISNNTIAGGSETANADYDGWFISPSATFLTPVNFAGTTSTASLRINYTGLFLDGGTESGASTAVAFGDRDIHLLGARAQLTVPYYSTKDNGAENRLEWRSGVEGQFNLSADDVTSSIAGTQTSFAADTEDQLSGFAGVSFTRTSADGLRSIGADVELQTGIIQNGMKITGQIAASMKF